MKLAYLDCFSGISGDMLLGAWVACGVPSGALEEQIQRLGLADFRLQREQVKRGAFVATRVMVEAPPQQPSRHYHEIAELLVSAPLTPRVQEQALEIFRRLGKAEATLHGTSLEKVHFHELGAIDSIADIVGSCAAMELLGIEELRCSPLNLGSGTVTTEHGLLPIPAPATAELLKGIPVYSSGIQAELVTPTGAAIVSTVAKNFGPLPEMKIHSIGYGAGTRNPAELPNLLRVFLGEIKSSEPGFEQLLMLEANLDDMNPQLCSFFSERAFAAGALDVYFAPVQMKKNRPGVLLSVLCRPEQRETLMELFFRETTTFGVRGYEIFRSALEREWVSITTSYGSIRIKVSRRNGQVLHFSPEFEDCRQLAAESGVPLRKIFEAATLAYWRKCKVEP
ncbi:MAG: nickel pincer cofactor biosynthesis protein LarC [Acidobacteria bacterium]|nr:nickel pincer cofactor biosynthesis protein LarC [Acidobacteriota bacterium]